MDGGASRKVGDDSSPASPPPAPAAPTAPTRPARLGWVRAATDRVPTTWFAGIATALFLAATAAFGGLADVPVAALPRLGADDLHESDQVALTIERAVLIDDFPEAGVTVEPGQRVLALLVTAENRWTQPLRAEGDGGAVSETLRVTALGDRAPAAVARYDDATTDPWLQPGVPAQLVATWAIEADLFAVGDQLEIDLRDLELVTGSFVLEGQSWVDPVSAAVVTVEVEDVGAGADAEEAEQ